MHKDILEYIKRQVEPLESKDEVVAWWQGLNEVVPSYDDLTEALEELEDGGRIQKQKIEKDLFIYMIAEEE